MEHKWLIMSQYPFLLHFSSSNKPAMLPFFSSLLYHFNASFRCNGFPWVPMGFHIAGVIFW